MQHHTHGAGNSATVPAILTGRPIGIVDVVAHINEASSLLYAIQMAAAALDASKRGAITSVCDAALRRVGEARKMLVDIDQECVFGAGSSAEQVRPGEPLLEAIRAYRAGMADFNSSAPEDDESANAYADRSYLPPMVVLEEWSTAAETKEGALAALALALDANDGGEAQMVGPMIEAALMYFKVDRMTAR